MTESSTETKPATKETEKAGGEQKTEQKTVPLEALGESRAKTRAANERADKAEAELAKAKETGFAIDVDALTAHLAAEARRAVEAEVAPLRAEASKAKMALAHGLNETQADKVMEIRGKIPNLTDQQAILLAKSENPEMFQASQPAWSRERHGGLPVSGDNPSRTGPAPEDFVAKMKAALNRDKPDRAEAQHWAEQEALRRFRNAFNNRPRS